MLNAPTVWWLVVYDHTTHTATRAIAAVAARGDERAIEWIGTDDDPATSATFDLELLERELAGLEWPVAVDVDQVLTVAGVTLGLLSAVAPPDVTDVYDAVEAMAAAADEIRRAS